MAFSLRGVENATFRGPHLSRGNHSLVGNYYCLPDDPKTYPESLNSLPCKLILHQETLPFKWILIRQRNLHHIFNWIFSFAHAI